VCLPTTCTVIYLCAAKSQNIALNFKIRKKRKSLQVVIARCLGQVHAYPVDWNINLLPYVHYHSSCSG
jgi:hypothetical protein